MGISSIGGYEEYTSVSIGIKIEMYRLILVGGVVLMSLC